ncbi:MAG TPA: response regulator [Mucilaginibacter sp.]|jgi:two-component system phosphate regulon response regulator PhoB|nr:response regulator [Mucilaginibacter sp.]
MSTKKNILIIEDDGDILQVLETVLTYNDFSVQGINRTDDIFETIEKYKPDLVLTDYLLSGLNGGKICQLIKSNKDTCHLPVMLISAYPALATSFGNFGFDAFINKPFNINDLVDKIKELLNKRPQKSTQAAD